MKTGPHNNDGIVASAARRAWKTRQFWSMIIPIIFSFMAIGYLVGAWYATNEYKDQSDSRKLILAQCIATNDKLTSQLTALGDKTADALDKLTTER